MSPVTQKKGIRRQFYTNICIIIWPCAVTVAESCSRAQRTSGIECIEPWPWLLPVVLFTTRIFLPNISQLKCSTGRRNVREIKTKCSQKYRDKSWAKTSQPGCQLVLKIIKEWKMFQQQPGKYFSCWENISQSLKHFIWKIKGFVIN